MVRALGNGVDSWRTYLEQRTNCTQDHDREDGNHNTGIHISTPVPSFLSQHVLGYKSTKTYQLHALSAETTGFMLVTVDEKRGRCVYCFGR